MKVYTKPATYEAHRWSGGSMASAFVASQNWITRNCEESEFLVRGNVLLIQIFSNDREFTRVNPGDWMIKDDNKLTILTHEQFQAKYTTRLAELT